MAVHGTQQDNSESFPPLESREATPETKKASQNLEGSSETDGQQKEAEHVPTSSATADKTAQDNAKVTLPQPVNEALMKSSELPAKETSRKESATQQTNMTPQGTNISDESGKGPDSPPWASLEEVNKDLHLSEESDTEMSGTPGDTKRPRSSDDAATPMKSQTGLPKNKKPKNSPKKKPT